MILGDTSAWVDGLRRRRTRAAARLDELIAGDELVVTDAVVLEVLAGARDLQHKGQLERLLGRHPRIPTEQDDFDEAAAIYRSCRRGGDTPRSMLDCLIAAVALRVGASVLHSDRDFDVIARHVGLAIDG